MTASPAPSQPALAPPLQPSAERLGTAAGAPECPQLETSTHVLQFFPPKDTSPDRTSYYTLALRTQRTVYAPIALTADCQLHIDPIQTNDWNDNEPELNKGNANANNFLAIKLKGADIGVVKEGDVEALAKFTAVWREALSTLAEQSPQSDSAPHGAFGAMTAVTNGLTAIPKLFKESIPLSPATTVTPSVKSGRSRPDSVIFAVPPSPTNSNAPTLHIIDEIYSQKAEFMSEKTVRLRMVTWNIHGESIKPVQLENLLGLPVVYDIYVVALQESDMLSPKNLYANTVTLQTTKDAIVDALGGPDSFQVISQNQLLGMMLVVVAATPIASQLSNPIIQTTGTGVFGIWGNKGAVKIRVTLGADPSVGVKGTDLVFVNCHLAAGEGKAGVERRLWEFSEIQKNLNVPGLVGTNPKPEILFSGDEVVVDDMSDTLPPSSETPENEDDALIFILGDLNYRVALDPEMVEEFVGRQDIETVLNHDQLTQQIRERKVLTGFKENTIKFPPTYKYAVGTDKFDGSKPGNNDKARAPSYTDRIFYKPRSGLEMTDYTSLMEYQISDHKPVVGSFELSVQFIDSGRRKTVVDRVLKASDFRENGSRPNVTINPTELLVDDAIVLRKTTGAVMIEHGPGSDRTVEWELDLASPYITVSPSRGHLPVGAKQYIHFSCVLPVILHSSHSIVQEVAILRILDSQDIFIPVEFQGLTSCLGASLEVLSRMPEGARSGKIMSESTTNMPREIWNCVDYLWTHCVTDMFDDVPATFLTQATTPEVASSSTSSAGTKPVGKWEPTLVNQIQDWLDTGVDFDREVLDAANSVRENSGVYSVARVFLQLLGYLDGGIVSAEYYSTVLLGKEGSSLVS